MSNAMEAEKETASAWFMTLRDEIVAAFEGLEASVGSAARFDVRETERDGGKGGGGLMSVLRGGAAFEKVGVNVSTVHGELGERAQMAMAARPNLSGIKDDPRFWASGISLVAHMVNPHAPAVHMNTRMFWTPHSWWFGGGTDLNPAIEYADDTAAFHNVLEQALAPHGAEHYPRLKEWADEYFFVPHRGRARGVGGIFLDDHNTGDWDADFALIQDIGKAFLPAFMPLAEARIGTDYDDTDKAKQLQHRGLYAEYNLVYDRGTKFGLETGHDPDAVLMSLPPLASWP